MVLFQKIKDFFRKSRYVKTAMFGAVVVPTNPQRVMIEEEAQGLRLLYTAATTAEAGLLSQVLAEAGFHMEYVPSASTGIFGTSGNSSIYAQVDEYEDARNFLDQYLNGVPVSEAVEDRTLPGPGQSDIIT